MKVLHIAFLAVMLCCMIVLAGPPSAGISSAPAVNSPDKAVQAEKMANMQPYTGRLDALLDCSQAIPINCGDVIDADNTNGPTDVSYYSCVSWFERGPELVYVLTTTSPQVITATLSNLGSMDVDVFILSSCDESQCITYGDLSAQTDCLPAGTYYIVCDVFNTVRGQFTLAISCTDCSSLRPCTSCIPPDVDLGDITQVVWGGMIAGNAGNGGKWVGQFTGIANARYHFDLCPLEPGVGSASSDIDIKICDATCGIQMGVDGSCFIDNADRWDANNFQWVCPGDGIYYVVIAPYPAYSIHNCLGTPNDVFELNYYRDTPPPPPTCPSNTLFGQPAYGPGGGAAYTSDQSFPYVVYDNFLGITGPICDLEFWGLTAHWDAGQNSFVPCDTEFPMTFEVNFYIDNAGVPGDLVCTYQVQPDTMILFPVFDLYTLYRFETRFVPCCNIPAGWISIQGVSVGDPDCDFLWWTSPVGDGVAYQRHPDGNLMALNVTNMAFCLSPAEWPFETVDMGDLSACNYPTLINNPGHGLSGIAWLGERITGEPAPNILNQDPADDGVVFIGEWWPCTMRQVSVTVTAGPNFGAYHDQGGLLFLNAWKDGNHDGDFCDVLECPTALAPEWIIQDVPVLPGAQVYNIFDPGLLNVPPYDGIFRFRLCSHPVGPMGYGLANLQACPNMDPQCGTFALDYLGEVEDYIIHEFQLAVELTSFHAVAGDNTISLRWVTASETRNDHFEIQRDGRKVADIPATNSATGSSYSWDDGGVSNGTVYSYDLVAVDANGNRENLSSLHAAPNATAATITEYALHQNYPNPFNASTTFIFDLLENGFTTLKIYNIVGQEVGLVVNSTLAAGRHTVIFDASALSSGTYIYRFEVNGFTAEKKMLIMK